MISGWIAEQGLHCTLNIGMWQSAGHDEPKAWGIFLADVIRHVANAIEEHEGSASHLTTENILKLLSAELKMPTSDSVGYFPS